MAKHLIAAAVAATQVVFRAFFRAVRQEVAASQARAASAGARHESQQSGDQAMFSNKMTMDEAKQILDIKEITSDEAQKRYDLLFKINDKSQGGSFYIQSKIYRAKERIDAELEPAAAAAAAAGEAAHPTDNTKPPDNAENKQS